MDEIVEGCVVASNKGHDVNRNYIVIKVLGEFALCVDGKFRPICKPKKKRIKHLINKRIIMPNVVEKLRNNKLYDFEITTFIKNNC